MVDSDTFLTTMYVMVDDFCQSQLPPEVHAGPQASLSHSEVITLGLFGQWACFPGERAFYRYAQQDLRAAFPTLPHRTQFNRLLRRHYTGLIACFLHLVDLLDGHHVLYQAFDSSAVPTRDAKRRGGGWLPGLADIGWSNRLGWYEGFHLLIAVNPRGVITGFGFGPASTKDQALAETFFALRQHPDPRCPSVGQPALGPSISDTADIPHSHNSVLVIWGGGRILLERGGATLCSSPTIATAWIIWGWWLGCSTNWASAR